MSAAPLPPRPDPADVAPRRDDRTFAVVVWVTVGVNAALGLLTLAGWYGRDTTCPGGCSWRPMGGMLWVILVVVDIGLVLIWAGIGYVYLVGVGQRIGRRISDRDGRDGD